MTVSARDPRVLQPHIPSRQTPRFVRVRLLQHNRPIRPKARQILIKLTGCIYLLCTVSLLSGDGDFLFSRLCPVQLDRELSGTTRTTKNNSPPFFRLAVVIPLAPDCGKHYPGQLAIRDGQEGTGTFDWVVTARGKRVPRPSWSVFTSMVRQWTVIPVLPSSVRVCMPQGLSKHPKSLQSLRQWG